MTRVLHVIPTLERGGAERSLVQLVAPNDTATPAVDHHIATFTDGGAFAAEARATGASVTSLEIHNPARFPGGIVRLSQLVTRLRPDVIQGWLYYGDLAATFAHALAARSGPRLMWNIRCSELDFGAYALRLRLAVRLAARLSGRPDTIIVNSKAGARAHEALGYQPQNFVHIPNGVDTGRFKPDRSAGGKIRQELGLSPDAKIVLHAARVDPQKDHATLIATADLLPHFTFLAAGRGTKDLKGPENFHSLGDRTHITGLMNAADLMVSTSAYGEGFPNVLAEAMACETPCVSTDCGDARSIVGDTGQIVPVGQPDAMAQAISEFFLIPREERQDLGEKARVRIVDRFTLAAVQKRYTGLWTGTAGA